MRISVFRLIFVFIISILVLTVHASNTDYAWYDYIYYIAGLIYDSVFYMSTDIVQTVTEVTQDVTGITMTCPYRSNVVTTLKQKFNTSIVDQQFGVEIITSAARVWEFSRNSPEASPLVLAISGPTGVGKSESAYVIAESFLKKTYRQGSRYLPLGAHVFNGKDYSSTIDIDRNADKLAYEVGRRINRCGGTSVIIFDDGHRMP